MARSNGRNPDALRPIDIATDVSKHAEGSCLIKFGDTHVLCMASVEDRVPAFLKGTGRGWVTAEYGMLPRATGTRGEREAVSGRQSGRTQEIQRLIGRALRAAVKLDGFGERSIKLDCDVLQADGGTRTASITGGFVATVLALQHLKAIGVAKTLPIVTEVAAVSCGILGGTALLDLDYAEDSKAEVDANFVMTGDGRIVEVQGAAEGAPFKRADFDRLMSLAEQGCATLIAKQRAALGL